MKQNYMKHCVRDLLWIWQVIVQFNQVGGRPFALFKAMVVHCRRIILLLGCQLLNVFWQRHIALTVNG